MLKPVFTEKSLKMAKQGFYTFWVPVDMTKLNIKTEVARVFSVHVVSVKTMKNAGESGRTARGRKFVKLATKKAVIAVKDGEKINVFEETKK